MPITTQRDRLVFFHDVDVIDRAPGALGRLAEEFEVTVPAYPGFEGQFDVLDRGWEGWESAADLAHHIRRSERWMSGDPVHLVGAGFGGWVALELALLAPERLASLVLVAPYGVKLFSRMDRDFEDVLLLDADEQITLGWADPDRCHGLRMPGYPADLSDEENEVAFAERETIARYAWKPFMHSRQLTRWVHTIDVPTLVVAGDADRLLHAGHSRLLAERLPRATYVEIPDAGHYPYLEQPELFHDALGDFYAQVKGA